MHGAGRSGRRPVLNGIHEQQVSISQQTCRRFNGTTQRCDSLVKQIRPLWMLGCYPDVARDPSLDYETDTSRACGYHRDEQRKFAYG